MPTPRHVPPTSLHGRVFTTVEAKTAGVSRHLLSGPAYRSWGRGLWSCRELGPDRRTPAGLQQILPPLQDDGWVASHTTAASLLSLRLPERLGRSGLLHMTSATGARPRGDSVIGHRAQLAPEDLWHVGAVRTTGPGRTLLDLASMLGAQGLPLITANQLVAAVDGVINEHRTGIHAHRPALRRLAELHEDLGRFAGRRGARRLRYALERAVVGVDSPMETYLRLLLVDHGLTGWETDVLIRAPGHRPVYPDLADRLRRLSVQFDGAVHEDGRQRMRDVERLRATEAAGWTELRVVHTDLDLVDPLDPASEPRVVTLVRGFRERFDAGRDRRALQLPRRS